MTGYDSMPAHVDDEEFARRMNITGAKSRLLNSLDTQTRVLASLDPIGEGPMSHNRGSSMGRQLGLGPAH